MKPLFSCFIIILLYTTISCGEEKEPFDSYHNPSSTVYFSALHYKNFLDQTVEKSKHKKMRKAVEAHLSSFEPLSRRYDSLFHEYDSNRDEKIVIEVTELGSDFKAWKDQVATFIKDNSLSTAFHKYDTDFNARMDAKYKAVKAEALAEIRAESEGGTVSSSKRSGQIDELSLNREIRSVMESYDVPYLDSGIAESGCLWVYTADNGKNRDGLAQTICYTASKYSIQCVTVFDKNQHELGRSVCK